MQGAREELFKEQAEVQNELKQMHGKCKSCDLASLVCNTGCRAAAYLEHGDLMGMDPACFADIRLP